MATIVREILPPAIGSDELRRRQSELAENSKPAVFNVAGQLLAQGRTDTPLAATEDLSIRLKIYAEGGEMNSTRIPAKITVLSFSRARSGSMDRRTKKLCSAPIRE